MRSKRKRCEVADCRKVRVGHACNENVGDGSWRIWICDKCLETQPIKDLIQCNQIEVLYATP